MQILSRHLAASMAALRRDLHAEPHGADGSRQATHGSTAGATSTVTPYQSDDSIFVDDVYLIKGMAGRVLDPYVTSTLIDGT
jgi:hypothetical protein